jgi:arylsulfatase A-like enzyme
MARPYHLPEYLHPTVWTVNESIRFLQRRDPTKPFFLKMSFARPHSPYDAPTHYFDLYDRRTDLPPAAVGDWAGINDVPADAADPNAWRGRRSDREIARARAGYYGNVHHIDHQIGRLMIYLRQQRLDEDTLIVFTSDHGDMLGDHHLWRKTYGYEGSAHVPLIVRLPAAMRDGVQAESAAPVCLQDIMPTILSACGLPVPASVDGRSLLPAVTGKESHPRDYVHGEHSTCYHPSQEMQYLTDGRRKYLWFPRTGAEQFFDLDADPYECTDLAADPARAAELGCWRDRLVQILAARDAGLTEGDRLVPQAGRPPLVSPNAAARPRYS